MKRRILTFMLVLVMLFTLFPPMPAQASSPPRESEPNDTQETANALSLNTDIIGNLSSWTDNDVYVVTLANPGTLQMQLTLNEGRFRITVWESTVMGLSELQSSVFSSVGTRTASNITVSAGTYYIRVSHGNSNSVWYSDRDYTLQVLHTPEPGSGYEKEFNDTRETANALSLNTDII